jgi:hypothetical protein
MCFWCATQKNCAQLGVLVKGMNAQYICETKKRLCSVTAFRIKMSLTYKKKLPQIVSFVSVVHSIYIASYCIHQETM